MIKVNGITIRRRLFLMIDVETFGTFQQPICYDVGMAVIDRRGKVYAQYSFVIDDTFNGMNERAKTAYYAYKFPMYHEQIANGQRKLTDFSTVRDIANTLCTLYGIRTAVAHNAKFDSTALDYTTQVLNQGRRFFTSNVEWWDTLSMVADTIAQQKTYIHWCTERGYMTKHKIPRPRMTAEIVYRYITGNDEFVESHTGLEDVLIEKEIFAKCCRQHKKMRTTFFDYSA